MTPAENLHARWCVKIAELKGWVDAMRWMADVTKECDSDTHVNFEFKKRLQAKFSEKQDEALKIKTPEDMVANELMED